MLLQKFNLKKHNMFRPSLVIFRCCSYSNIYIKIDSPLFHIVNDARETYFVDALHMYRDLKAGKQSGTLVYGTRTLGERYSLCSTRVRKSCY